jgi:hypothetical protein
MPSQVRSDERTHRNDSRPACTDVVECTTNEPAPESLPFGGRLDVRMHEDNCVALPPVPNLAEHLPAAEELIAKLGRIVLNDEVGHDARP